MIMFVLFWSSIPLVLSETNLFYDVMVRFGTEPLAVVFIYDEFVFKSQRGCLVHLKWPPTTVGKCALMTYYRPAVCHHLSCNASMTS